MGQWPQMTNGWPWVGTICAHTPVSFCPSHIKIHQNIWTQQPIMHILTTVGKSGELGKLLAGKCCIWREIFGIWREIVHFCTQKHIKYVYIWRLACWEINIFSSCDLDHLRSMPFDPSCALHFGQGFFLPNLVAIGHFSAIWPCFSSHRAFLSNLTPATPMTWHQQYITLWSGVLSTKFS